MAKYKVQCVRYGFADVEAESEEAAIDMAESLPSSAYSWSDANDHEVIDRLDSYAKGGGLVWQRSAVRLSSPLLSVTLSR